MIHLAPRKRLSGSGAHQSCGRARCAGAAFGVVLGMDEWEGLAERLKARETRFVIEPGIRFQGLVGEQATMFLFDPCGNALEFKAFKDIGQLFAK